MEKVIKMVEYVKGSKTDRWHWCENCTQYPMFPSEKTSSKPSLSELCEQCRTKEENGSCRCKELRRIQERQLKNEISAFCDTYFGDRYSKSA